MDALEVNRAPRPPLFVFFPTISTHIPFTPTPPYQPDWARMLTDDPYDEADVNRAYLRQPDWMDLGHSYADAVSYMYQSLTGYLRLRADRDFVMILIGDHQPAAAVSGEGRAVGCPRAHHREPPPGPRSTDGARVPVRAHSRAAGARPDDCAHLHAARGLRRPRIGGRSCALMCGGSASCAAGKHPRR